MSFVIFMKKFLQSVLFWSIFSHGFLYLGALVLMDSAFFYLWIVGQVSFWFFFGFYMFFGVATVPIMYYLAAIPLGIMAQRSGSEVQKRFASTLHVFIALAENFGLRAHKAS